MSFDSFLNLLPYAPAFLAVTTIVTMAYQFIKSNYISSGHFKISSLSKYAEACITDETEHTILSIREQLAFRNATGIDESPNKIKLLNKLYKSGLLKISDLKAIANYLDNESGSVSIKLTKFDKLDSCFSLSLSIFILILITAQYAYSAYVFNDPFTPLITVVVALPFLYFISSGHRKYTRIKKIKKMLENARLLTSPEQSSIQNAGS